MNTKQSNTSSQYIEKFSGDFSKEDHGCSILINQTMNNIRDLDAAGMYSYLSCRPKTWKINVKHLMAHFKCGKDKIYSTLTKLIELGLLTVLHKREKGKFTKPFYMLHLQQPQGFSPCPEKPDTVQPDTEKPDTYKTKKLENKESKTTTETKPIPNKSGYNNKHAINNQTKQKQPTTVHNSLSEHQTVVVFESSNQDNYVLNKIKDTPKENSPDCDQVRFLKEIKFHIEKHYPDDFNKGINAVAKLLKHYRWSTPSGYVDIDSENAKKAAREREHQARMKSQEELGERKRKELQEASKRSRNEKQKRGNVTQPFSSAIKQMYEIIGVKLECRGLTI